MKIKRMQLATALGLSFLILTGCSSQGNSSSQKSAASSQNTTEKKATEKKDTEKHTMPNWNAKKDTDLESYMKDWQSQMNQSYQKYDGKTDLKTSDGMTYPSDLSKVKVEGTKQSIGWSHFGNGKYRYNIVAIYNYEGNNQHITYFFAFHKGNPVVLVDQSNGGMPDLKETENSDLKENFYDIADGKSYSASNQSSSEKSPNQSTDNNSSTANDSSSKQSTESVSDPKIQAVLIYQQVKPDFDISDPNTDVHFTESDGKYSIAVGSSSASDVQFNIEGDTVHYWQLDLSSAETVPDAKMKEATLSLSNLVSKYYATDEQKQSVQTIADRFYDAR